MLGAPPRRDEQGRAGLVHVRSVPDSTRVDRCLACAQLGPVVLGTDLLNERLAAGQHYDDLIARRMALPACPRRLGGPDHHQTAIIAVGLMISLIAGERLLAPSEVRERLGPRAQAEMHIDFRQVEARCGRS